MDNPLNAGTCRPADASGYVLIIAGVSGAGKTTVGKALAERLNWRYIEGDDFHPAANVAKMQRGEPLNDADREPWLRRLREEIKTCLDQGERAVLACSALKESYRARLRPDPERVHFVFLTGSYETLHRRLAQRRDHFMGPDLLTSQLETLDLPEGGLIVDIDQPVDAIVDAIMADLSL
ncbi:gluconokinase [Methylobacter sp. YRD-M1]|uniref:gluconokinase n=1 Tax=Methylobacter sp. YRD-M1 TaxID=2911520 RepID=UPI00227D23FC|nr:gluconokinase, GntK/IdnK-type [Methylobacter sp. YRD-M1]WAK03934.1 gluconokinase, GntK/IdnK-type [Methylobacter sp. YRD-M1]